jgi:glycosyltransferase involved in cell wall biosynthesis
MKTVLIAHNYTPASFAIMSYSLANYLAQNGYNVVFISHRPYFEKEEIVLFEKGKLIITSWSSLKRPTGLKDYIWFAKLYFKFKPDVVIGHFVGSNISIALSKLFSFGKVKTFEYYHTLSTQLKGDVKQDFFKQKLLYLRKLIFYNLFCDTIICPSAKAKLDLKVHYKVDKSVVLLNSMVDRFSEKTKISTNEIVISYLGRLDQSKGIVELINAFEIYKSQNQHSKIILNIAGSGSLSTFVNETSKTIEGLQFYDFLAYHNVDSYLNASHFVIIPSKIDNLPTVGLEALMNQTPLLVSYQTGLSDYLIDGASCYKFDPSEKGILSLFHKVETNFFEHTKMEFSARAEYIKQFSIKTYCENFYKLIQ